MSREKGSKAKMNTWLDTKSKYRANWHQLIDFARDHPEMSRDDLAELFSETTNMGTENGYEYADKLLKEARILKAE